MQKLTKFKVIFDLFTVCVYFTQQHNCRVRLLTGMDRNEPEWTGMDLLNRSGPQNSP